MGGDTKGFIDAGFNVEVGIDVWDVALQTHRKYLRTPVKRLDLSNYYPTKKDFDVIIVGGTPCQDFSRQNRNRNIYSKKSQLVLDFCRIVKAMQPEAFVFENVVLLSKWATAALLEMPGYKVTPNLIDTADFGVPQKRHRKIFIGAKDRHVILSPPRGEPRPTVRDAFNTIPENWGFMKHRPETVEKFSKVTSHTWISKEPTSNYRGIIRLNYDTPSCGLVNVKKAQVLHPVENRVITMAEALALQSFPHWYIPEGTGGEKAIQIADAIPPRLAYHIARALISSPSKLEVLN